MRRWASIPRIALAATVLSWALVAAPARAQREVPPAAGIAPVEPRFALAFGGGRLVWDDGVPFDDVGLISLTLERRLWRVVRGRAGVAYGSTTLDFEDSVDTRVMLFDLQVVLDADVGPLASIGVVPYAVVGVGSVVTNPSGERGLDLPTRSQSQVTYGGGLRTRLARRLEFRGEATVSNMRFADPVVDQDRETDTIHNLRWEGRIQWLF